MIQVSMLYLNVRAKGDFHNLKVVILAWKATNVSVGQKSLEMKNWQHHLMKIAK